LSADGTHNGCWGVPVPHVVLYDDRRSGSLLLVSFCAFKIYEDDIPASDVDAKHIHVPLSYTDTQTHATDDSHDSQRLTHGLSLRNSKQYVRRNERRRQRMAPLSTLFHRSYKYSSDVVNKWVLSLN